jgi:hypothetical protein
MDCSGNKSANGRRSRPNRSRIVVADDNALVLDQLVLLLNARTAQRIQTVEPPDEEANAVCVDEATLFEAERYISGCENCLPEDAEITFDYILDGLTGCHPRTHYVLCRPARCRGCKHEVLPKIRIFTK